MDELLIAAGAGALALGFLTRPGATAAAVTALAALAIGMASASAGFGEALIRIERRIEAAAAPAAIPPCGPQPAPRLGIAKLATGDAP